MYNNYVGFNLNHSGRVSPVKALVSRLLRWHFFNKAINLWTASAYTVPTVMR